MANSNNKQIELNPRQKLFCQYYVELGNGAQAAIKAGYKETTARHQASQLLTKKHIKDEIARIKQPLEDKHIATGQEVMEFFTKMMNGEIKDAFGLDATNSDRLKAANELAKRTVDVDNRAKGQADAKVEISINWDRSTTDEVED